MSGDPKVLAVVTSADGALSATIDVSDWIAHRADADRVGLLEAWEHGFAHLGDELEWFDYVTPEIEAIIEQILALDRGETVPQPSVTIDPQQILPFIKRKNTRCYAWLLYQIEALGGRVDILPAPGG